MKQRIYILYIVMAAILMVGYSGGSDKNAAWDESAALMGEAEEGVFNDVICGHHWKSDIDAGQQLAAVVFAAVSASEAYQAQLKKAREEYQRIIAEKETSGVPALSPRSRAIGQYYNLLGRRLEAMPDRKGM